MTDMRVFPEDTEESGMGRTPKLLPGEDVRGPQQSTMQAARATSQEPVMEETDSSPPSQEMGDVRRGFNAGIHGFAKNIGMGAMLGGEVLPDIPLKQMMTSWGEETYKKNLKVLQENFAPTPGAESLKQVFSEDNNTLESLGKLADWTQYQIGQAAGSSLPFMAAGLASGSLGAGVAVAQGIGEVGSQIYEDTGEINPQLSTLYGVPAGMLDAYSGLGILKEAGSKTLGKAVLRGMATEAPTEAAQDVLARAGSEHAQGFQEGALGRVFDPELMLESAAAGAVGGGILSGGIHGLAKGMEKIAPPSPDEEARRWAAENLPELNLFGEQEDAKTLRGDTGQVRSWSDEGQQDLQQLPEQSSGNRELFAEEGRQTSDARGEKESASLIEEQDPKAREIVWMPEEFQNHSTEQLNEEVKNASLALQNAEEKRDALQAQGEYEKANEVNRNEVAFLRLDKTRAERAIAHAPAFHAYKRLLPQHQAQEGLASDIENRGNKLAFRMIRSPEEAAAVLQGIEEGDFAKGFRPASIVDGHSSGPKGAKFSAALKKGAVPFFTSPYPTVSKLYDDGAGLLVAIEYKPEGDIYVSSRAGSTEGKSYSAIFSDAEHIVDANKIVSVKLLSPEQEKLLTNHTGFFESQVRKGVFKNTYRDKDAELVAANLEESRNLRPVKTNLERPFLEAPVVLPNGLPIMKGTRVRLASGATASLQDLRGSYLQLSGIKGEVPAPSPQQLEMWRRQVAEIPQERIDAFFEGSRDVAFERAVSGWKSSYAVNTPLTDVVAVWDKEKRKWQEAGESKEGSSSPEDREMSAADDSSEEYYRLDVNKVNVTKMFGKQLYGDLSKVGSVTLKELFQNSFDTVRGELAAGRIEEGRIDITLDRDNGIIKIEDNGAGMDSQILTEAFFTLGGTNKPKESKSSGGYGVAKGVFLVGNEEIHIATRKDGIQRVIDTTGDEIFNSLEESRLTGVTPPIKAIRSQTTEPNGTSITVKIPKKYWDVKDQREKEVDFPSAYNFDYYWDSTSKVLWKSPLFEDKILVTVNGLNAPIGKEFPSNNFAAVANIKHPAFGAIRVIAKKEKSQDATPDNAHVLINGLWQFDLTLKDPSASEPNTPIKREFYLDIATDLTPKDAGYPIGLNRQGFAPAHEKSLKNVLNYLSVLYAGEERVNHLKSFGSLSFIDAHGNVLPSEQLVPAVDVKDVEGRALQIEEGDTLEVKGDNIYRNGKKLPRLEEKDLEDLRFDSSKYQIPQSKVNTGMPIVHNNVQILIPVKERVEAEIRRLEQEIKSLDANDPDTYEPSRELRRRQDALSELRDGAEDLEDVRYRKEDYLDQLENEDLSRSHRVYYLKRLRDAEIQEEFLVADKSESAPLPTAGARKFGIRFGNFLKETSEVFKELRNLIISSRNTSLYANYSILKEIPVGVSFSKTGNYYGIHSYLPFQSMLVNPLHIKSLGNNNRFRAARLMTTMVHEIAHANSKGHDLSFIAELQDLFAIVISEKYVRLTGKLKSVFDNNEDIIDWLHEVLNEYETTNIGLDLAGEQFTDPRGSSRENTRLSGVDDSSRRSGEDGGESHSPQRSGRVSGPESGTEGQVEKKEISQSSKSVEEIEGELEAFFGKDAWNKIQESGIVKVVSPTEASALGMREEVDGLFSKGKIFIRANAKEPVLAIMLHEGQHAGMEALLGSSYGALQRQFLRELRAGNSLAQKAEAKAQVAKKVWERKNPTAAESEAQKVLEDERLSYFISEATKSDLQTPRGLLRRIVDAIKAWFRQSEIGKLLASKGISFSLSDGMAIELAKRATLQGIETSNRKEREIAAGADARTLPRDKFELAKVMRYKKGKSRQEIFAATQMWIAKDGVWRFEIDDSRADLKQRPDRLLWFFFDENGKRNDVKVPLSEVLYHPKLFAAYPQLMNLMVSGSEDPNWSFFSNSRGRIELAPNLLLEGTNVVLGVLLHEIQHAVQTIEGFAKGTSPSSSDAAQWVQDTKKQTGKDVTTNDYYYRSHGEVEARAVTERMFLVDFERKEFPFFTIMNADVSEDDQIVRHSWEKFSVREMASETPSEISELTRKIRTQNKTRWNKANLVIQRWVRPGGLFQAAAPGAHEEHSRFYAAQHRLDTEVERRNHTLRQAILNATGKSKWVDVPREYLKKVDLALRGGSVEGLDDRVTSIVDAQRRFIDTLSDQYVRILHQQLVEMGMGKEEPTPQMLAKAALLQTILSNQGSYLHRSYRVFQQKGKGLVKPWYQNVPEDVLQKAIRFVAKEKEISLEAAASSINNLLTDMGKSAAFSLEEWIRTTPLGKHDLSILMHRNNQIPQEILDVMGVHTDPLMNFAATAQKQIRLVTSTAFLERLKSIGLQNGWLFDPTDEKKTIPVEFGQTLRGGQGYEPLAGLRTSPEVVQALNDATDLMAWPEWLEAIVKVSSAVKLSKTVYSPAPTAIRNYLSSMMALFANADFNWKGLGEAMDAAKEYLLDKDLGRKHERLEHLAKFGVSLDTPFAGEMKDLQKDIQQDDALFFDTEAESKTGLHIPRLLWKTTEPFRRGSVRFYQFADDLVKITAFKNLEGTLEKYIGARVRKQYVNAFEKSNVVENARIGKVALRQEEKNVWRFVDSYGQRVTETDRTWTSREAAVKDAPEVLTKFHIEHEVAERIRNTYMTYSMVGRAVKFMRKLPLTGTFVSFTAEVIRTVANMLHYIQHDFRDPDLRPLAIRRFIGMTFMGSVPYVALAFLQGLFGADDDEMDAAREASARWNKLATLVPVGRDENGKLEVFDVSFLDLYSWWHLPVGAVKSKEPWDDRVVMLLQDMLEPFLGMDITMKAVKELVQNRKADGSQVFSPAGMPQDQIGDIINHIWKTVAPTTLLQSEKILQASLGRYNTMGEKMDFLEEWAALGGFRKIRTTAENAMRFGHFEQSRQENMAIATLSEKIGSVNSLSEKELHNAYLNARNERNQSFEGFLRKMDAARHLGMTDAEMRRDMRLLHVGGADIASLMRGEIPKWRPDTRLFKGQVDKGKSLSYSEEVQERIENRRRLVLRWMREDLRGTAQE